MIQSTCYETIQYWTSNGTVCCNYIIILDLKNCLLSRERHRGWMTAFHKSFVNGRIPTEVFIHINNLLPLLSSTASGRVQFDFYKVQIYQNGSVNQLMLINWSGLTFDCIVLHVLLRWKSHFTQMAGHRYLEVIISHRKKRACTILTIIDNTMNKLHVEVCKVWSPTSVQAEV